MDGGGDVEVGHPVLAFTDGGTRVAVWLAVQGQERSLWMAAGSAEPAQLDDGDPMPVVNSGRDPGLATWGEQIAVVTGSSDGNRTTVDLWTGTAGTALPRVIVAESDDVRPVDQPEVAFDEQGGLVVVWKEGGVWPDGVATMWAATPGGAPVVVGGLPGKACPCCAHALQAAPGGGVALAVRNDVANVREVYVATAPSGSSAFGAFAQVSFRGWWIPACPIEGPELATSGDALWAVWSDGSSGDLLAWLARGDGVGGWQEVGPIAPGASWDQQQPRVVASDGALWVATHQPDAVLWRSNDEGASFQEVPLPLSFVRIALAHGTDGVRVLGTEGGTRVWEGEP